MSPSQIQMSYEDLVRTNNLEKVLCESATDAHCKDALLLHVRSYLPKCMDEITQYCVESFSAFRDGIEIKGQYVSAYPAGKLKG